MRSIFVLFHHVYIIKAWSWLILWINNRLGFFLGLGASLAPSNSIFRGCRHLVPGESHQSCAATYYYKYHVNSNVGLVHCIGVKYLLNFGQATPVSCNLSKLSDLMIRKGYIDLFASTLQTGRGCVLVIHHSRLLGYKTCLDPKPV